jgi:hypothetical protein
MQLAGTANKKPVEPGLCSTILKSEVQSPSPEARITRSRRVASPGSIPGKK